MSESLNTEYRAKFPKGKQAEWMTALPPSVCELALISDCSERTIRDWRREKCAMDYVALVKICRALRLPIPKITLIYRYAHTQEAGRKGGAALVTKYGRVPVDESQRLSQWRKWWKTNGRHVAVVHPKHIRKPQKSPALAEFVGIMMGDGGISDYQLTITLHKTDDKAYGLFVSDLIRELFAVPVSVRPRNDMLATNYVISRREMVHFCTEVLGLKKGDKIRQMLTIPEWIKGHVGYARACMRGLMDTDGSVFTHHYVVKGRQYQYKKLSFSSASPLLRRDVAEILHAQGIKTSTYGTNVRVEAQDSVRRYFKRIGSHNPKHLIRYAE